MLNMITGVDRITSGEVIIGNPGDQVSVQTLDEDKLALWRGRNLGVIFQSLALPMLTLWITLCCRSIYADYLNLPKAGNALCIFLNLWNLKMTPGISGHFGRPTAAGSHRASTGNRPSILVADDLPAAWIL